jgi:hypothetical protein
MLPQQFNPSASHYQPPSFFAAMKPFATPQTVSVAVAEHEAAKPGA